MSLFYLIKQQDSVGPASDPFGQLPAFFVSHIPGRSTRKTTHGEFLHIFGHIKTNHGIFISEADVRGRSRVAVLGSKIYEKLFDEGIYPIGQAIKINRIRFRVVGVMEEKGGSAFGSADNAVYVPLTTVQARLYPCCAAAGGSHFYLPST